MVPLTSWLILCDLIARETSNECFQPDVSSPKLIYKILECHESDVPILASSK